MPPPPATAILRRTQASLRAQQLTFPANFRAFSGSPGIRRGLPRAPTGNSARSRLSTTSHARAADPKPTPKPSDPDRLFSLDDLGATRTVKVVIYVTIAVLTTVETFVWAKAGWRWYAGKPENEGEESVE
ncbi:hypothetical protein C8J57DRAFT_250305 [Mycena rebaudengoi]|nr:hypothetical protein C8J57DRAFT_250305 [Mycena rebaudengoi]